MANRERSLFLVAFVCLSLAAGRVGFAQPPADAETPQPAVSSPDEYQIGAGDVLQIFVWRQPDLSVTVPVRPDGRISTPLIDDLIAVGKTPTQLANEMEKALSQYLRAPQVNVIVKEFMGLSSAQIRVTGQALKPQSVPYRDRMTLLDVVIAAGGLTKFAAGNRSRVVRTVNGKQKEIRVRLDDLMNHGDIKENIPMRPGDVLIIPERVF